MFNTPLRFLLFLLLSSTITSCGTQKKYTSGTKQHKSTSLRTSAIVKDARSLIKKPYRYGGEGPRNFDCSGLVAYVYLKNGVQLPRRSADQARFGRQVSLSQVRPGDLIFFKSGGRINHVGIVTDTRGKYPSMVHSSSSRGVIEEDLDAAEYWRKRYATIRRL